MSGRESPFRGRGRLDERGAAAVEFALVLPILLVIVFGIVNYGMLFAAQLGLSSAARDAARAGVVQQSSGSGMTCQQIATQARGDVTALGVSPDAVAVSVSTSPDLGATCTLSAGSTTVTGSPSSATSKAMCTGSSGSGQLQVDLSYVAKSPVPLVPPSSMTLHAQGGFQCEYS